MPIVTGADAPTFALPDTVFTGLAAPSRGASENAVWRVRLTSTEAGAPHTLDREEVLVAVRGRAVASLDGAEHVVAEGDAIVVPAGVPFALRCADPVDGGTPEFEAVAVLPVGGRACLAGGEPFTPPWAQ
jgi:mannose-6-phosphate isomerase-like protein (cupin superfamily)